ncbi:hypothetical protein CPC08DRAFT_763800 [Agrocybe pediades]|nr:hypothetical protein CPC08DRAFT_763800 [Agrocybe pediades]
MLANFGDARQALVDYVLRYDVVFSEDIYDELPCLAKEDKEVPCFLLLKRVEDAVSQKVKEMYIAQRTDITVELWDEEPITCKTGGSTDPWQRKFNNVTFPKIRIEENATLNILLHRLMEYTLAAPPHSTTSIHLSQFPHFYSQFPLQWFSWAIPCLKPWSKVKEYDQARSEYLHLIMDRSDQCVRMWDGVKSKYVFLPEECGSAWQVEKNVFVVRNRVHPFSLAMWDPRTPYVAPSAELEAQQAQFPTGYKSIFRDSSETLIASTRSISTSETTAGDDEYFVIPISITEQTGTEQTGTKPNLPPLLLPVKVPAPAKGKEDLRLGSMGVARGACNDTGKEEKAVDVNIAYDESPILETPSSVVDSLCGTCGSSVRSISLLPLDFLDESGTPIESINVRVGEYLASLDNYSIAQAQVYPPVAGSNYPYQLSVGQPCCYTCFSPAYFMPPSNANYNSGNVWKNSLNNVGNTTINVKVYYPGVPMTDSPVAETDSAMDDEDYSKSPTHVHDQKHGTVISDTSRRNTV